jgi:hypothetical protein
MYWMASTARPARKVCFPNATGAPNRNITPVGPSVVTSIVHVDIVSPLAAVDAPTRQASTRRDVSGVCELADALG